MTTTATLRRFVVCYTRTPTNFNPTQRALVDAETPELARDLVAEQLGDRQNKRPCYVIALGVPHEPPASKGSIVSMTGG
jgi:hypothetical protein